jgi:hypothetical protein
MMSILKRWAVFTAALAAFLGLIMSTTAAAAPTCGRGHHHGAVHQTKGHEHPRGGQSGARHHRHAPRDCPAGTLCAYTGDNYTGDLAWVAYSHANLRRSYVFHHVHSLYDNTRHRTVTVYTRSQYRGQALTLRPGTGVRHFAAHTHGHIKSVRWHRHHR